MSISLPRYFTNLFRPRKEGGNWFYAYSSSSNAFDELDYLKAFMEIPEVNAVIGTKANYYSNGIFKVVNDKLEEQVDNPINKLLKNPNWFQAGKEFLMQSKLFHEIYGNEYLYHLVPIGFKVRPDNVSSLFTLPPNLVKSKYKNKAPFFLFDKMPDGIVYCYEDGTRELELPAELIIHLNDNRVCVDKVNAEDLLEGESKLEPLKPVINNLRMAYESRGIILKNRGANGAWSPDGKDAAGMMPLTEQDIEEMQKKFARNYGTLHGQSQTIISSKSIKWVQAGVNDPQKLGLFQETEEGFRKLVDAYGMHPDVFATVKGATFENQKQAEKGIYIRTIIPEANVTAYALNQKHFPDGKLKIIADYSHLSIFQEDLKVKSEAIAEKINYLSKLLMDKQITQDEYRTELLELNIGDGKAIPPPTNDNQADVETRSAQAQLRGSVGGVQGILNIQTAVSQGTTTREAALGMLTIVYGYTDEQASQILGNPKPQTQE